MNFKNKFPFSFATPSYIYPAGIKENLLKLKNIVDEVELILFESEEFSNLPSKAEINEFKLIAEDSGLRYNVHLPLDADITCLDKKKREKAIDSVNYITELTSSLNPTTYTLHVYKHGKRELDEWKQTTFESLNKLNFPTNLYSVETLNYDLRIIDDILKELKFSICLDLGHLILNKMNIKDFFKTFIDRTTMIHLHGVVGDKDHVSLNKLDKKILNEIYNLIKKYNYSESLCLEIFSLEDLQNSEKIFMETFKK